MARMVDIHMSDVTERITLNVAYRVRGIAAFKVRAWLGCRLIIIAAHIMGMGVKIEAEHTDG